MFKRGSALSTLGIFKPKVNVKYSRLVFMDFNIQDLRPNPSQEGVFDEEQATNLKFFQSIMSIRRMVALITHGSGVLGEDPLGPLHAWDLKRGSNEASKR